MTDTTRQSVDRWEVTHNASGLGFSDGIRQSPHGNFVTLDDYAALLTRAEAAEAALEHMGALVERLEATEAERDALIENNHLKADAIDRWTNTSATQHQEIDALQAKLAVAVEGLKASEAEIDGYILDEYPFGHPSLDRYRKRDYDANPARIALAQLTADTIPDPRIEGWNAAIEAAARKVEIHNLGRNKERADRMLASIRAIPCPYTPKEGKDDDQ